MLVRGPASSALRAGDGGGAGDSQSAARLLSFAKKNGGFRAEDAVIQFPEGLVLRRSCDEPLLLCIRYAVGAALPSKTLS
ncbi:hypothetical protein Y1Q_0016535 [Alligator mississippiensis]|uniref:Uncharacterized protein n=1 Tax=Alligator mississippiensis TaxID=8496 RepID=A0A151N3Q4_ALLMI|nr:hypothetical protein Y1Q_0016535 [Alligator mississippiensis]